MERINENNTLLNTIMNVEEEYTIPQSEDKFDPSLSYLPILNFEFFACKDKIIPIYAHYSTKNELKLIKFIESDAILLNYLDEIVSMAQEQTKKGVSIYWVELLSTRKLNEFLHAMPSFSAFPANKSVVGLNISSYDLILCNLYFKDINYQGTWLTRGVKTKGLKDETYQGDIIKESSVIFENKTMLLEYGKFASAQRQCNIYLNKIANSLSLLQGVLVQKVIEKISENNVKKDKVSFDNKAVPFVPEREQKEEHNSNIGNIKNILTVDDRKHYSPDINYVSLWHYKSQIKVDQLFPGKPELNTARLIDNRNFKMVYGIIKDNEAYLVINYPVIANEKAIKDAIFKDINPFLFKRTSKLGIKKFKFYFSQGKDIIDLKTQQYISFNIAQQTLSYFNILNLVEYLNSKAVIKYIVDYYSEDRIWEKTRWGSQAEGRMRFEVEVNKS